MPEFDYEESLHELARAMMRTRPDLEEMSLDEWAHQYWDILSEEERKVAFAICDLFYIDPPVVPGLGGIIHRRGGGEMEEEEDEY